MPEIFTFTAPKVFLPVKKSVFQSSPPKPMLVVAGYPWTIRPSFLPCEIEDPYSARAAAVDVACCIDLHAVGVAGFAAIEIREHAVGLLRQQAVRKDVEGSNLAAPGIR